MRQCAMDDAASRSLGVARGIGKLSRWLRDGDKIAIESGRVSFWFNRAVEEKRQCKILALHAMERNLPSDGTQQVPLAWPLHSSGNIQHQKEGFASFTQYAEITQERPQRRRSTWGRAWMIRTRGNATGNEAESPP